MNPFDCESTTGECSNRDPRRIAISLNTFTIGTLLNHPIENSSLSVAPRELTPCGQCDLSTPESLLIPFPADLAQKVVAIFDRLCKLSASTSRIACPCSHTMPAPASMWNVCPFMFLPFSQRRCRRLLLTPPLTVQLSSDCSSLSSMSSSSISSSTMGQTFNELLLS